MTTLKYILSRVYGPDFLPLDKMKKRSAIVLTLFSFFGYVVFAMLIVLILLLIIGGVSNLIGWASGASLLDVVGAIVKFFLPFVG